MSGAPIRSSSSMWWTSRASRDDPGVLTSVENSSRTVPSPVNLTSPTSTIPSVSASRPVVSKSIAVNVLLEAGLGVGCRVSNVCRSGETGTAAALRGGETAVGALRGGETGAGARAGALPAGVFCAAFGGAAVFMIR